MRGFKINCSVYESVNVINAPPPPPWSQYPTSIRAHLIQFTIFAVLKENEILGLINSSGKPNPHNSKLQKKIVHPSLDLHSKASSSKEMRHLRVCLQLPCGEHSRLVCLRLQMKNSMNAEKAKINHYRHLQQ